jgi:hypothetical protein
VARWHPPDVSLINGRTIHTKALIREVYTEMTVPHATFPRFLQSLLVSWKTMMSGAASIILAFLAVYLPAKLSKDALFCAAGICILYAAYETWATERNKLATLSDSLTRPDLRISLHRCYRSSSSTPRFLLDLYVVNNSPAPVTVTEVNLEIVKDGREYPFAYREDSTNDEAPFHVGLLDSNAFTTQARQLTDLMKVITSSPLERGTHRAGSLIFLFDSVPVLTDPVRVRLTLTDAYGDKHSVEQEVAYVEGCWMD